MKIAIIGPAFPLRGGIAQYLAVLHRELAKNHAVVFISFRRQYPRFLFPGTSQLEPGKPKIKVDSCRIIDSLNPFTWIRAFRIVHREKADLLIFKWWTPFFGLCFGTISLLSRRFTGSRVIFICDNAMPHERRPGDKILTRFAFSQVDRFLVMSGFVKNELLKLKPRAEVREVFHPDYSFFAAEAVDRVAARREVQVSGNVILFFGYVRPYKGLEFLIEAMPLILREIDATLLVVGDFYEPVEKYTSIVKKLGIGEKVKIMSGYIPDDKVGRYFSAADVVVLPYTSGTQSGVVQVAYAFEVPAVSTKVGGVPEAISDGETGLLVPPGDSNAIAEAVIRFFKDDLGPSMRENIRAHREKFSWAKVVEAIEN
ncbi:MAG: glycosyltransferase [Candidatus Eisenbacteria bacterium]|nr:glycosyltransferase [Candidatus Eisenbacteria bacterium]